MLRGQPEAALRDVDGSDEPAVARVRPNRRQAADLAVLSLLGRDKTDLHLFRNVHDFDVKTELADCLGEPTLRSEGRGGYGIAKQQDHPGVRSGLSQESKL